MSRVFVLLVGAALGACQLQEPLPGHSLQNIDGRMWQFPAELAGKIVVVGFIYTHCPDVCGMTMGNLLELWRRVGNDTNVVFATITLDPRRDVPARLRQYAQSWNVPSSPRWLLLTGTVAEVERVHKMFGVIVRKSYSERLPDGNEVYFLDHTDAIFLLDRKGIIRDRQEGSTLDVATYAQLVQQYAQMQ